MKAITKIILLILLAAAIIFAKVYDIDDYLTFENLKKNREALKGFVKEHYALSAIGYISLYISTAFFIPGAIPLTIAGGFLFGVFWGTIYVFIGAITGAALAFYSARHLMGNWLQQRYRNQLIKFNEVIDRRGYYYLLLLRIVPVLPFFLVNYLAGITRIPFRIFMLTLLIAVIPGAVVFTFAGRQLAAIESINDIFSAEMLMAFLLLVIVAFSPLFFKKYKPFSHIR